MTSTTPITRHAERAPAPEAPGNLQYFGGPVVSNIIAVSVLWGSNVDPSVAGAVPQFLTGLTSSSYMDWLCEYNTLGLSGTTTNQVIGRGSFGGQFTIMPQHTGIVVDDTDIQAEAPAIGGTSAARAGGTISLTATGGTAPYEWLFDPGTGAQVIPGATGAALTLSPATPADAGTYWVSSKGSCTALSAAWPVTVTSYDLTFLDDAGVAQLCVNSTTGAYQFSILTGTWAGQKFTGTGAYTVNKGVGKFKTPPSVEPHVVAHDYSGRSGKVQFSSKSPHIKIHFKDSDLSDDPSCP